MLVWSKSHRSTSKPLQRLNKLHFSKKGSKNALLTLSYKCPKTYFESLQQVDSKFLMPDSKVLFKSEAWCFHRVQTLSPDLFMNHGTTV